MTQINHSQLSITHPLEAPYFLQAIRKGFLASYPRLTPAMVTTYLTFTAATARGYLDQHWQGLDSTAPSEDDEVGSCPTDPPQPTRTAFTKIIPV